MESTNDRQTTVFICTPGLSHYSFFEALFKNPLPVLMKSQYGKFYMTTFLLDINDEIYIVKCLTYIITIKTHKYDTEKHET